MDLQADPFQEFSLKTPLFINVLRGRSISGIFFENSFGFINMFEKQIHFGNFL